MNVGMNLEQLKTLCKAGGEKKVVEYKTSTGELRAAFETVCAFLNTKGGTVLIGVKDDGRIAGQHISDNTQKDIAREIKKIEPTAPVEVDYIELENNKFVIAIHVNAGEHAPYTYDGRAWQRNESDTNKMSQHHYEQLLVKRGQLNHSWEDSVADNYTIAELNHDEINKAVLDGITENRIPASVAKEKIEKILRQLNLLVDGKPKRAAVALFAKEIKSRYRQCWLKMARFKGTDKLGDFIDNQQIHCNVFEMLKEADNFLRKHLPIASYFKPDQFKRIDKPALPVLAVREALVNAICHRNYADRSGYISIGLFDDRVEIWNNGTLPSVLTFDDLKKKHESVLRNELIAEIFYLRGYIEAWGTGTTKMIDFCKKDNIPAPKFSESTGGFLVTFKFAEPIGGHKRTPTEELTPRQRDILKLLKKSPLNSNQITASLKTPPSKRMLQIDLKKLEAAGLVKSEGERGKLIYKLADNQAPERNRAKSNEIERNRAK